MEDKLNKIIEALKAKYKDSFCAVYMRGSQLYNLNHAESDIDVIVVVDTQLITVLNSGGYSRDYKFPGESWEYKLVDEYSFIKQVLKGNFMFLEALTRRPLAVSPKFEAMANFVYENRQDLFFLNPVGTFNSLIGNSKAIIKKLEKDLSDEDKLLVGTEFPGKQLQNVERSLLQFKALRDYYELKTEEAFDNLMEYVSFHGEVRDYLLSLKVKKRWETESELKDARVRLSQMNSEVDLMKDFASELTNRPLSESFKTELLLLVRPPKVSEESEVYAKLD